MMPGFDLIGDIHAQADRLKELLRELGYTGIHYTHPKGRRAVFLGDFINRGSQNRQVIEIVQKMVQKGALAIMGNHEFKAICYAHKGMRGYIRPHTPKNTLEQAGFLEEYPFGSSEYKEVIQWFRQLSLYVETPEFRVIHACWNKNALDVCGPLLSRERHTLKSGAYKEYDTENRSAFAVAIDDLIKGRRYRLPRGLSILNSLSQPDKEPRIFWWERKDAPAERLLDKGSQIAEFLTGWEQKSVQNLRNKFNYASELPVFIGHYNLPQPPDLVAENVACLNFKDRLVAYRWNEGDKRLSASQLVYV